jgi:hypothetical protein
VPGGYSDTTRSASSSSAPSAPAPKTGGCGGGCACH